MPPSQYADGCPECLAGPVEPHTVQSDEVTARGAYRCPECGHTWTCSWNIAALGENGSADSAGDVA